jgi:hypothetical protein
MMMVVVVVVEGGAGGAGGGLGEEEEEEEEGISGWPSGDCNQKSMMERGCNQMSTTR